MRIPFNTFLKERSGDFIIPDGDYHIMKPGKITLFLVIVCGLFLVMGCSSSQDATQPNATAAPANSTLANTTLIPVMVAATPATPVGPTIQTPKVPDPILHRWIRINSLETTNSGRLVGYELQFFPDGTVNYLHGLTTQIAGNIQIEAADVYSSGSGTWLNRGNNKYYVKILPTGENGIQFNAEYTWVPEYTDASGVDHPEHIESQFERDAIPKNRTPNPGEMFFPVRAKID